MKNVEFFSNENNKSLVLPELDPSIYIPVDMLYNIGRFEGGKARGLDVINGSTDRREYFTLPADFEAENLIKSKLGEAAILPYVRDENGYSVYAVSVGARPLKKTLDTKPYSSAYMNKLDNIAKQFMDKLKRLDPNKFGVTIESIAIVHNGGVQDSDDAYLTIVPPVHKTLNQ